MDEKHYRLRQAAERTGYQVSTLRKKLARREIGYRKCGRLVLIPESELNRMVGQYRPPLSQAADSPDGTRRNI
jgi:excisionase family DNA binding protein